MTNSLSPQDRRRITRAARDAFPPMGVYAVRGPSGVAMRVHASTNVWGAINRMQFELRLGGHRDKELQAEWARDPAGLTFDVLEMVKERADSEFDYKEELQLLEQLYRSELCVDV
jgi:hypothetical protein